MPEDKTLKNMRIAVTGFDGFIGSRFVTTLRSLNIPAVLVKGDVRLAETWTQEFDVLYHLAAVMPGSFADSPEATMAINVDGTVRALEACRKNKARMVLASTCGVYKPASAASFREDGPVDPPADYTKSKYEAELKCQSFAKDFGLRCTVFRLFNVYGPGQGPGYVIPYLIDCALKEREAEIYHLGSSRDFVYVDDVIDAFLRADKAKETFGLYNIGLGQSYTIGEAMDIISQACGKKLVYRQIEGKEEPQPFVRADIEKAGRELGWSAKIDFADGIEAVIADLRGAVNKG